MADLFTFQLCLACLCLDILKEGIQPRPIQPDPARFLSSHLQRRLNLASKLFDPPMTLPHQPDPARKHLSLSSSNFGYIRQCAVSRS